MSPLREARSLTERYDKEVLIETLKRYYLIFEGSHTEVLYFEGIVCNRKKLGINNMIEIVILHKEGEVESYSHPKKLLELVNAKKAELRSHSEYDKSIDKFVIIFDRDSYKSTKADKANAEYLEFVSSAEADNILAVTSPCFELWLILHCENAVEEKIRTCEKELFENRTISKHHTYTSKLCSDIFHMNPKKNLNFDVFEEKVDLAILQEKKLEQTYKNFIENIGSNIGTLMEILRDDPRKGFM